MTQGPTHGPTAHLALLRTVLFVWPRAEKKTAGDFAGLCWPVLVVAAVEPRHICCGRTWPSNQTGGVAILASSSLLDQIPHQVKSQTSVAIFRHTRRQESSCSVTPSQFQFLVQSQGVCLFCWAVLYRINLFYVSLSHLKVLAINKQLSVSILRPTPSALQGPNATKVRATSIGTPIRSKVKLPCHC